MKADHALVSPSFCCLPSTAAVADVGQEEEMEAAREKALKVGAKKFFLEVRSSLSSQLQVVCLMPATVCHSQDLKKEFIEHLIYPAVQANAIYEVCFSASYLDKHSSDTMVLLFSILCRASISLEHRSLVLSSPVL